MTINSKLLALVNERLLKHDYKILFDGRFFEVRTIAIRGFTSPEVSPFRYNSIQDALDAIAPIVKDASVTRYNQL